MVQFMVLETLENSLSHLLAKFTLTISNYQISSKDEGLNLVRYPRILQIIELT